MPKPAARAATACAIRPLPTRPSVLPETRKPRLDCHGPGPFSATHKGVASAQFTRHAEHERKGHIRCVIGDKAGIVRHPYAVAGGSGNIHMIKADAKAGNDLAGRGHGINNIRGQGPPPAKERRRSRVPLQPVANRRRGPSPHQRPQQYHARTTAETYPDPPHSECTASRQSVSRLMNWRNACFCKQPGTNKGAA